MSEEAPSLLSSTKGSSDPIDSFLDSQRAEGRYFDSSAFTIDSVRAMQKLGAHQLPDSGVWIVKLVQAAVAGGADEIRVNFGRRKVRVEFTPRESWQADEILEVVLSGTLPADRALSHLVTALRGCTAALTETVTWSCGSAAVELNPTACRVSKLESTPTFVLDASRPKRSRSLARVLKSSISALALEIVEEVGALQSRCWVSPIPIYIDGSPLPRSYGSLRDNDADPNFKEIIAKYGNSETYHLKTCLAVFPLLSTGRPKFSYLKVHPVDSPSKEAPQKTRPVYSHETFLSWPHDEKDCQVAGAVVMAPKVQSKVYYLLDGAVVESRLLGCWEALPSTGFGLQLGQAQRSSLAIRLFVGVEPSDLDLSHFKLRKLERYGAWDALAPQLEKICGKVNDHIKDLVYVPTPRSRAPKMGALAGASALGMTALIGPLVAVPCLGVGAAFVALNLRHWRQNARTALQAVRKELQEG